MTNQPTSPPMATQVYTTAAGLQLTGDAHGDPDDPPVLFLHGGGQTRHAWGGAARTLARQGMYAITLDLRGHGESDWSPEGNYAVDDFAADLTEVASTFSRPPAVVGASLGGMTGLITAGSISPERVSALVLVDFTPRVETEGVNRILDFMQGNPDGFANVEEAGEAVARYIPNRPKPKNLDGLRKNLRLRSDGHYHWHWDPKLFSRARNDVERVRNAERLLDAARNLTVPTLLVRGGSSDVVSESGAQEFLDAVPHAQYVDVAGAGHMVAGDRNDQFSTAVVNFLKNQWLKAND
ncbi:MAG: alpha/beta hydrolase [Gammaproteobacteria bacterium]|nr:alpha/beta hydrolase [Gammaproteobacteria bacterium]